MAFEGYREARWSLRIAIKRAKAKASEELLQDLEEDPWGQAYKLVLKKLRPAAPPSRSPSITSSLKEWLAPFSRRGGWMRRPNPGAR